MTEEELTRIRKAYEARDRVEPHLYSWNNPGYVAYIQGVERAVLHALREVGMPLDQARVLDVGCGSGYFLHRFREYGARECEGIDMMEPRIVKARQRYPTLVFRTGSATELPYDDGAFDLVTQFTCLSSILDDDVRLAAAHEIRRVARHGWILSFDIAPRRLLWRNVRGATPTVSLNEAELGRLFGKPALLCRAGVNFSLAQRLRARPLLASGLGALPFAGSHLLGVWSVPHSDE